MNGYELMNEFDRVLKDIILVPNSWLPEEFRDHRTDSVSLADLEIKCESREYAETEHRITKQEKDRRVALYQQMIDNRQEISYLIKGSS